MILGTLALLFILAAPATADDPLAGSGGSGGVTPPTDTATRRAAAGSAVPLIGAAATKRPAVLPGRPKVGTTSS
jgi:hypothetical protein